MTETRVRPVKPDKRRESVSPDRSKRPFNEVYIKLLDTTAENMTPTAHLDSLADANFASENFISTTVLIPTRNESDIVYRLGNGSRFKPSERVDIRFQLLLRDGVTYSQTYEENFLIVPGPVSCSDVILGAAFTDVNNILSKAHRFAGFVAVKTPESEAKHQRSEAERLRRDKGDLIALEQATKESIANRRKNLSSVENRSTTASTSQGANTTTRPLTDTQSFKDD